MAKGQEKLFRTLKVKLILFRKYVVEQCFQGTYANGVGGGAGNAVMINQLGWASPCVWDHLIMSHIKCNLRSVYHPISSQLYIPPTGCHWGLLVSGQEAAERSILVNTCQNTLCEQWEQWYYGCPLESGDNLQLHGKRFPTEKLCSKKVEDWSVKLASSWQFSYFGQRLYPNSLRSY